MLIIYTCEACGIFNELEYDEAITAEDDNEAFEVQCEACKHLEALYVFVGKDRDYYDDENLRRHK